jgi:hypothetical protein
MPTSNIFFLKFNIAFPKKAAHRKLIALASFLAVFRLGQLHGSTSSASSYFCQLFFHNNHSSDMKRFFIITALAALLIACKNTPKESADTQISPPESATAAQPAPELNLDGANKTSSEIRTLLGDIISLRKQVDALPEAVKKSKATEVEYLRSMLSDMEERENMFLEQLNTAISATKSGTSAALDSTASNSLSPEGMNIVREVAANQPVVLKDFETLREQFNALSKN